MKLTKIGLITSGGDAPGMNAAIRGVVKYAMSFNINVVGFYDGFDGLIDNRFILFDYSDVNNIVQLGGTIIGTARSERFLDKSQRERAYQNLQNQHIQALIVIGGDGSFRGALQFMLDFEIPVIGIPGTIDNDIQGTNYTIGFDTCLNTVTEAVDKIRDTATSHHRIFFIEVMGRNAGKIALNSALSAGADSVLIPEEHTSIEEVAQKVIDDNRGQRSSIVIVAEGDELGGAQKISEAISKILPNHDIKYSVLGHIQRGGKPTAFDRMIATQMGARAVDALMNGEFGKIVGLIEGKLELADLETSHNTLKLLNLAKLSLLEHMRTRKKD
jgi:6-phosphofructokinase 1